MTSRDFAFWCQGFFEIGGEQVKTLNEEQVNIIKRHLALVFKHEIDPSQSSDPKVQQELQDIHDGVKPSSRPPYNGPGKEIYRC
jgi:hypothetical protein